MSYSWTLESFTIATNCLFPSLILTSLSNETNPPKRSSTATSSLAARLESRYQIRLSADLIQWFDDGVWDQSGGREYCEAIDPELLLSDAPEAIWPGLMPCDFLPIVANGQGDCLAIRVASDGTANQIVQWYHGGGDWICWGNSLAEAVLFDAVHERLPGPNRRHAIPAITAEPASPQPVEKNDWLVWAIGQLSDSMVDILGDNVADLGLATLLLENQVCEIAVRCELVQAALDESLSRTLTPQVASELDIDWNTATEWMFDLDRIPDDAKERLGAKHNLSENHQDWRSACEHATFVANASPESAWAWDMRGYALEKQGDIQGATQAYQSGLQCSAFTDQSVRLRTHWAASQNAKFAASRLLSIGANASSEYLKLLCGVSQSESEPDRSVPCRVTDYWLRQAEACVDPTERVKHLFAAGWDLGADPISQYGQILDRISQACADAGQLARSQLADTHRQCLRERYGV